MSENKLTTEVEPFPEPDSVEAEALEEWSWVMQERGNGRFEARTSCIPHRGQLWR